MPRACSSNRLSGIRKGCPAAVAREQSLPQLHFELADLTAERRLGHAQKRCRAREAVQLGDMDEVRDSCLRSNGSSRADANWEMPK